MRYNLIVWACVRVCVCMWFIYRIDFRLLMSLDQKQWFYWVPSHYVYQLGRSLCTLYIQINIEHFFYNHVIGVCGWEKGIMYNPTLLFTKNKWLYIEVSFWLSKMAKYELPFSLYSMELYLCSDNTQQPYLGYPSLLLFICWWLRGDSK